MIIELIFFFVVFLIIALIVVPNVINYGLSAISSRSIHKLEYMVIMSQLFLLPQLYGITQTKELGSLVYVVTLPFSVIFFIFAAIFFFKSKEIIHDKVRNFIFISIIVTILQFCLPFIFPAQFFQVAYGANPLFIFAPSIILCFFYLMLFIFGAMSLFFSDDL